MYIVYSPSNTRVNKISINRIDADGIVYFFSGVDPWRVSADERAKHDNQFFQLKPVAGFITGEYICHAD